MNKIKLNRAIPQLPSGSLKRTAEFFEISLGFKVVALLEDFKHLIVIRDQIELHFWETSTEKKAYDYGSISSCYIRVENIHQLFEEFKKNNVVFRYELTTQPWGMKEMQIDDPYNNAIRFGEAISTL